MFWKYLAYAICWHTTSFLGRSAPSSCVECCGRSMRAWRSSRLVAGWLLLLCLAASAAQVQAGTSAAAAAAAVDGGSHARKLTQARPPCVGPACGPPGGLVGPAAGQQTANVGPAGQPAPAASASTTAQPVATTVSPSAVAPQPVGAAANATAVPVPLVNSTDGAAHET